MAPMRHATDTRWTLEDARECFKPGARWAYREPGRHGYREAEIHSIAPDRKPPRVRIVLFEDGFEVARKAVPCGRLRFPWSDIETVRAHEARLAKVRRSGPSRAEALVVAWCFENDRSPHWRFHPDDRFAVVVLDPDGLALEYGLERYEVEDENGFDSEDGRVVGWTVLEKMVRVDLMRDGAAAAKRIVEDINWDRRWKTEARQARELEYPWASESELSRYLGTEETDALEEGLALLCPDLVHVQKYEDARHLLGQAIQLLVDIRAVLADAHRGRRYDHLDERIALLRTSYVDLRLESEHRGTVVLAHDLPRTGDELPESKGAHR